MNRFNVKDGSVQEFFAAHGAAGFYQNRSSDSNAYYYMKDTLLIKHSAGIEAGEMVVFELADRAEGSRRQLINTYSYLVELYDDICVLLRLTNFEIHLKEDQ